MIPELKKTTEQKMQKSLEALKNDLGKVRTGRAHTGILDHVQVDYYGSLLPINQVANINLIDARTIGVTPWEKKMGPVIEKAIRESDLGLNPSSVGDTVRVPMLVVSTNAGTWRSIMRFRRVSTAPAFSAAALATSAAEPARVIRRVSSLTMPA